MKTRFFKVCTLHSAALTAIYLQLLSFSLHHGQVCASSPMSTDHSTCAGRPRSRKTIFVSRFSRAEHVDTLVSWIEAQNRCLQNFALLLSQGLPPAILTALETKLRFALGFWLRFRLLQKSSQVRLFALRFRRRSAVFVERPFFVHKLP